MRCTEIEAVVGEGGTLLLTATCSVGYGGGDWITGEGRGSAMVACVVFADFDKGKEEIKEYIDLLSHYKPVDFGRELISAYLQYSLHGQQPRE